MTPKEKALRRVRRAKENLAQGRTGGANPERILVLEQRLQEAREALRRTGSEK